MKKYLLLLAIAIVGFTSCEKNNGTNGDELNDNEIIQFKDPNFLKALLLVKDIYGGEDENGEDIIIHQDIDKNKDGQISIGEAKQVTHIQVGEWYDLDEETGEPLYDKLTNIDEIKYFTALKFLECYWYITDEGEEYRGLLTSLDVSHNTELIYLDCGFNQITSLDLSKNTALERLGCWGNQLTSLDVSNNTALESLSCGSNKLTSLDVSNNTALESLSCWGNQLTSLDVSNNTALKELDCDNNQLTFLDVRNNTALEVLACDNNQLTFLDVRNNTALEFLSCYSNKLTSLDLSKNTALERLRCWGNQLTSLDVSNNKALTYLDCDNNPLTKLILYKKHTIRPKPEVKYGDIIEYVE